MHQTSSAIPPGFSIPDLTGWISGKNESPGCCWQGPVEESYA